MKNINKLLYRLVAILMVSVLVSSSLLCGLLAKYSTSGTGEDSARVIKFHDISVTEKGDFVQEVNGVVVNKTAIIIPGVNLEKDIKVSFGGSEAETIVFIELDLEGEWTKIEDVFAIKSKEAAITEQIDCVSFKVNGTKQMVKENNETEQWTYLTNEGSKYVYYCVLEPNEKITNMEVIENGDIFVSEKITRARLANLTNYNINVQATAVQANGFEDVVDAWNSVKNK